jgi:hypothetical protein
MPSVQIQSGTSCLFWDDLWSGQILRLTFPELYSFTKKPNMTLAGAKSSTSLISTFNLPLSVEAFEHFLILEQVVHNFQPTDPKDEWTYIWGRPGFSCSKAYRHLTGSIETRTPDFWLDLETFMPAETQGHFLVACT